MIDTYKTFTEKSNYYKHSRVQSVNELKIELKKFENFNCVFRGVKEAKFYNYSSAQVNTQGVYDDSKYTNAILDEIALARRSKYISKMLRKLSHDNSDFQVLSLLQHYGFGTPILDFSYKVNYAIFFSLDGVSEQLNDNPEIIDNYASLYFFNLDCPDHKPIQDIFALSIPDLISNHKEAQRLYGKNYKGVSENTQESYSKIPYQEIKNIASGGVTIGGRHGGTIYINDVDTGIYATYDINNNRSNIQKGLFKFNPSPNDPYEVAAVKHYSEMCHYNYCIDFPKSLKKELTEEFLEPYNICSSTVYPNTKKDRMLMRALLTLPIDKNLRPRNKPSFISTGTWKKLNRLYNKKMKKLKK